MKTRFAPSPTGFLHIGGLRTALFSYLIARQNNGNFLLRIEDTDRERFVEGGTENIINSLNWAGIKIDEGPYFQSERLEIYGGYIQKILASGHAYKCYCSKERLIELRKIQEANKQATVYDGKCRELKEEKSGEFVIRLKVPKEGITELDDLVRGKVKFENKVIDDQVLLKADGYPTYHFAVVVDDFLMEISHVVRGEDWLPSTPKHILIYRALGWEIPKYGHLPLLVNEKKQKMSKRHGDVSVEDFREKGYLAEALINFVAFLGWNPGDDKEIFSLKDLEKSFKIEQVGHAAAVFNREKLNWYNKQYIMKMDLSELTKKAVPFFKNAGVLDKEEIDEPAEFEHLKKVVSLEQSRASTLLELVEHTGFIFADELEFEPELLIWKKGTKEDAKDKLSKLLEFFGEMGEGYWSKANLESKVMDWINESGYMNGDVLWPLRVALSGQKNSPGPFEIADVLGKDKTLDRLKKAELML